MLLSQVEISCEVWHKNGNARKFIRNRLLHPLSREEEEPDFDHIQLCSPDQSKLDSCFGDDQYIVCAMNRDETAHELSFNIIKAMFHQFIGQNRYYFNVHTFIDQQINKRSFEDWKLCRHNHGHHGKDDSLISDIVEIMEMKDILIQDYIKTRWIDLYPQDDTGDDSDLQLLHSSHQICMIDWCDEENNFWPTDINLSPAEEKWLEDEVVKKGFKRFTQTSLVLYYMAFRIRKKKVVSVLMT